MRTIALILAVFALTLTAVHAAPASAAPTVEADADDAVQAIAMQEAGDVDDNDDTRVEVQLVVLAIVVGGVLVVGTGAYLLRQRLGLVPPPPGADAGAHH